LVVLLLVCAVSCIPLTPEAQSDKITSLPGWDANPPFDQYAGYLQVDAKNNRNLFYWFVESTGDPAKDPVVLWTNGGPGCSGLIGFFTEQGPFSPLPDGKSLQTNYKNAWNTLANIIFIEAPAGVGFSYSDVQSDYHVGDWRTAQDNYQAILVWLSRFPQYNSSDFYLASESYGGHYIPTLTQAILKGNAQGINPNINFKGFFLGNPYTDPTENEYGTFITWGGHSLISKPTLDGVTAHCFETLDNQCETFEARADGEVGDLDPYGLDWPICTSQHQSRRQLLKYLGRLHLETEVRKPHIVSKLRYPYDPCRDSYTIAYVNQPSVIQAIHANPNLGYPWDECSDVLRYNYSDMGVPMEPIYQQLLSTHPELHMTIFSGDDDSVCGTLGTQLWMWGLNLTVVSNWTSWTDANGQVGGFHVFFKGLNLVTIHSAGHMVSSFEPERGLEAFRQYLAGNF